MLDMGEPVRTRTSRANDPPAASAGRHRIVYAFAPRRELYEELLAADEALAYAHAKLRIAQARYEDSTWLGNLRYGWSASILRRRDGETRAEGLGCLNIDLRRRYHPPCVAR